MKESIRSLHYKLISKQITCEELITKKINLLKPNYYLSSNFILEDYALKLAKQVDDKIKKGKHINLLSGIPFGLKDVFLLKGTPASGSSAILKSYIAPYSATTVKKLIDLGAIPIVKENCDAFGHGNTNENSVFGTVKNAINTNLVAGGSSGGSAVNVAKNYTIFSLGGDTGGSIRLPAGYNGVFGLKPTYGKISRYGVMAYASSMDCIGHFTNNLEDLILVFNAIKGIDDHDQTSYESKEIDTEEIKKNFKPENFPIGYYTSFINSSFFNCKLKNEFLDTIKYLENQGFPIISLDFFNIDVLISVYYILAMTETASNLARIDGTNFGIRSRCTNLKEGYLQTRSLNFSDETKARIIAGNQLLSQDSFKEIYNRSKIIRKEIEKHFLQDFKKVKLIISPVSTDFPKKIGSEKNIQNSLSLYFSDAYTVGFSLGKLPTLTVPFGTSIGIQITANKHQEQIIFKIAYYLEQLNKSK